MEVNKIYNMDCIDGMKQLEDKSVDLIVTDPPYNANKGKFEIKEKSYNRINEEWDKFSPKEFMFPFCSTPHIFLAAMMVFIIIMVGAVPGFSNIGKPPNSGHHAPCGHLIGIYISFISRLHVHHLENR